VSLHLSLLRNPFPSAQPTDVTSSRSWILSTARYLESYSLSPLRPSESGSEDQALTNRLTMDHRLPIGGVVAST
jgi:hypothetical protein